MVGQASECSFDDALQTWLDKKKKYIEICIEKKALFKPIKMFGKFAAP